MALKIIHVMEFQILFAQIFFYFSNIRQSASPQAARFLDVAPTSGLKSCVHDFLLHCLVFKEHCFPASSLSALCASQLLYNTSFSPFCQELFWNIFYRFFKAGSAGFPPQGFAFRISATTIYILPKTRNYVNTFFIFPFYAPYIAGKYKCILSQWY